MGVYQFYFFVCLFVCFTCHACVSLIYFSDIYINAKDVPYQCPIGMKQTALERKFHKLSLHAQTPNFDICPACSAWFCQTAFHLPTASTVTPNKRHFVVTLLLSGVELMFLNNLRIFECKIQKFSSVQTIKYASQQNEVLYVVLRESLVVFE